MVEEQATLAELQRIADEVCEALGEKPIKARLTPRITDGFDLVLGLRLALVSRTWTDEPDFAEFRFRLVFALLERQIPERVPLQRLVAVSFLVSLVFAFFGKNGTIVWLATSSGYLVYIQGRQALLARTEPFLRTLLSLTHDPDRIRRLYTAQSLPEKEFAKLDAIVREMGLESARPAQG